MSIRQLLEDRAAEMAAHDGVPVSVIHLHGAAAALGADIRRELDAAIAGVRPAGAAHAAPAEEIAVDASAVASGDTAGEIATADAPAADDTSAPAAAPDQPASAETPESVS